MYIFIKLLTLLLLNKKIYILLLWILFAIFIVNYYVFAQDVNYGYALGSTNTDNAIDLAIDKSDNSILVGNFSGNMDIDPSSGTYNLTSSNDASFIAKYNNLGQLIWANKIEASGAGAVAIYSLVLDDLDNIYILISITSTTDLDPSANTNNVLYAEGPLFIAKYDKNGNYISNVGSLTFFNYPKLCIDKNRNLFVFSSFSGNFDIDPTASTFTLTNLGSVDIFLSKYSSSLSFISAFSIGGANNEKGNAIFVDSLDNIFIAGKFEGTTDFDISSGI